MIVSIFLNFYSSQSLPFFVKSGALTACLMVFGYHYPNASVKLMFLPQEISARYVRHFFNQNN